MNSRLRDGCEDCQHSHTVEDRPVLKGERESEYRDNYRGMYTIYIYLYIYIYIYMGIIYVPLYKHPRRPLSLKHQQENCSQRISRKT